MNFRLQDTKISPDICNIYEQNGIQTLYPWQAEVLQLHDVFEGKQNLVYSAPTSGGKTLVSEVLLIQQIIRTGKKALFVLPYVSVVREKMEDLQRKLMVFGKCVRAYHGESSGGSELTAEVDLAVCTIEKANSMYNRLLEDRRVGELCCVVVDEVHMMGDAHRGYLIEILLSKVKYTCADTQIICMSATLPNIQSLAEWLKAALYTTDYRPVPLKQMIQIENHIFDRDMQLVRTLPEDKDGNEHDHVALLCWETVSEGHSVLVFCPGKQWCLNCSDHIAKWLKNNANASSLLSMRAEAEQQQQGQGQGQGQGKQREQGQGQEKGRELHLQKQRALLVAKLRAMPDGICEVLKRAVPQGVAYHHAGLTLDERVLVEAAFRSGVLNILVATSTLAAGVNLPARRVIFRSPQVSGRGLTRTEYQQMSGRAGRAGQDEQGESILLAGFRATAPKLQAAKALLRSGSSNNILRSCLTPEKRGLERCIIEMVASQRICTQKEVVAFVKHTLLADQITAEELQFVSHQAIQNLIQSKLLESSDTKPPRFHATLLGRATFASGLSPKQAVILYQELSKAKGGLVLKSELHLCHILTPMVYTPFMPKWDRFQQMLSSMDEDAWVVAEKVGVTEGFLVRSRMKAPKLDIHNPSSLHRPYVRLYMALILRELLNEKTLKAVESMFDISRGELQRLQTSSTTFAGMATIFCEKLRWRSLALLIAHFRERLNAGVQAELLDLMKIDGVKAQRARALFHAGLTCAKEVLDAGPQKVMEILGKWTPYHSSATHEQEHIRSKVEQQVALKITRGARCVFYSQQNTDDRVAGEEEL